MDAEVLTLLRRTLNELSDKKDPARQEVLAQKRHLLAVEAGVRDAESEKADASAQHDRLNKRHGQLRDYYYNSIAGTAGDDAVLRTLNALAGECVEASRRKDAAQNVLDEKLTALIKTRADLAMAEGRYNDICRQWDGLRSHIEQAETSES